jgi:hypothetical protein
MIRAAFVYFTTANPPDGQFEIPNPPGLAPGQYKIVVQDLGQGWRSPGVAAIRNHPAEGHGGQDHGREPANRPMNLDDASAAIIGSEVRALRSWQWRASLSYQLLSHSRQFARGTKKLPSAP